MHLLEVLGATDRVQGHGLHHPHHICEQVHSVYPLTMQQLLFQLEVEPSEEAADTIEPVVGHCPIEP